MRILVAHQLIQQSCAAGWRCPKHDNPLRLMLCNRIAVPIVGRAKRASYQRFRSSFPDELLKIIAAVRCCHELNFKLGGLLLQEKK